MYNSRQDILAMLQEIIPDPTPEEIEEVPVNDGYGWRELECAVCCYVCLKRFISDNTLTTLRVYSHSKFCTAD